MIGTERGSKKPGMRIGGNPEAEKILLDYIQAQSYGTVLTPAGISTDTGIKLNSIVGYLTPFYTTDLDYSKRTERLKHIGLEEKYENITNANGRVIDRRRVFVKI